MNWLHFVFLVLIKLTLAQWLRIIALSLILLRFTARGIAQLGSAPALGAGGRGFESLCPDQFLLLSFVSLM